MNKKKSYHDLSSHCDFFSVYDAHLPSILKWNGVCVSAWHALDVRWLRRFFKLHFFLDCCYVLFSYRLSNGYGLTHYRMMHQVRPNIFMCLGNRGRSLQRNWTTPLIFSDFSALDTHTHTHMPLHFRAAFYKTSIRNICVVLILYTHADNLCVERRTICVWSNEPILRFENTICINFMSKRMKNVPCCWCNLCLSLCCFVRE